MASFTFRLPDIGEGVAQAEIVAWHVKTGDRIEEDQVMVDVMTDKATVEMTSPVTGIVRALRGEVGTFVPVGSPLVEFDVEGEASAAHATVQVCRRQPPKRLSPCCQCRKLPVRPHMPNRRRRLCRLARRSLLERTIASSLRPQPAAPLTKPAWTSRSYPAPARRDVSRRMIWPATSHAARLPSPSSTRCRASASPRPGSSACAG